MRRAEECYSGDPGSPIILVTVKIGGRGGQKYPSRLHNYLRNRYILLVPKLCRLLSKCAHPTLGFSRRLIFEPTPFPHSREWRYAKFLRYASFEQQPLQLGNHKLRFFLFPKTKDPICFQIGQDKFSVVQIRRRSWSFQIGVPRPELGNQGECVSNQYLGGQFSCAEYYDPQFVIYV